MLRPTVSLSFADGLDAADCIALSAGSICVENAGYEPESVVPRSPWRVPSDEEKKYICSREDARNTGRSIRVLQIPSDLIERFHRKVFEKGGLTQKNVKAVASGPEARTILAEFNEFARTVSELTGKLPNDSIHGGFCVKDAGLKTVTVDLQGKNFIGLHVDDWFRLPVGQRAQSPTRICANFGWCDRFLLILSISVDDMYFSPETPAWKGFAWRREIVNLKGATALGRKFLQIFKEYPITKIRIKPGQAYVAPTENLMHDGSSESGTVVDVACHVHGQ